MRYFFVPAVAALLLPAFALAQSHPARSGEQVVQAQCTKCHAEGIDGAPRLGARDEWIVRLTKGLDATVHNAIRGHRNMPARGGMAELTDPEIRAAVIHMVNYGLPQPTLAAAPPPREDPHRKVVGGTEVLLGVMSAEALRARGNGEEAKMHGGIPSGKGYYHVNVALHDRETGKEIRDAKVSARVATPLAGETKTLNAMVINKALSYGNYFRLTGHDTHVVTLTIRRPGVPYPIEAKFELVP